MLIPIGSEYVNTDRITRVYNFANGKIGSIIELGHPDCYIQVEGLTASETALLIEGKVLAKDLEKPIPSFKGDLA
jgi:hypothetical protein